MCIERNEAKEVNPVRCQVRIAATRYARVSKLGSSSLNTLRGICRRKFVIGEPSPTRISHGLRFTNDAYKRCPEIRKSGTQHRVTWKPASPIAMEPFRGSFRSGECSRTAPRSYPTCRATQTLE